MRRRNSLRKHAGLSNHGVPYAPTGIKYDLTTIDTFLDTCRELESTERQHCLLWRQPLDRSLIVYI